MDLLEIGDFLLSKAEWADQGSVRAARFQGMESYERGDGFILPFLVSQHTTLAPVRRRQIWVQLDRILGTRQRQFQLCLFLQNFRGALPGGCGLLAKMLNRAMAKQIRACGILFQSGPCNLH